MLARIRRQRRPPRARSRRVLIVIENIALGRDRAKKQVQSLLSGGWQVIFICRRDPDNQPFRSMEGLHLYEYRPPAQSSRRISYIYEYAYSLLAEARLIVAAHFKHGFDVLQTGNPPDAHSCSPCPSSSWAGPL
jgi:hypothetical protein